MDEAKLIRDIRQQPRKFGQVYDHYNAAIFNYAYRRTGNYAAAQDITSETFLKAFLSIHRFRWKGISLKSWLYRIATNEANLWFRRQKYQPANLSALREDYPLNFPEAYTTQEAEQEHARQESMHHEQFLKVQQQLTGLPLKYQEVISLKYFEKMTARDIGEILGKPEGTVKSLISRGLAQLRKQLGETGPMP